MILKGIGFVVLGIGLFLLATYVGMRLWNWLVPSLFNGPRLRFVQALGLFFLTRLLLGFGGLSHSGLNRGGHHGYGAHHAWRNQHRMEQRLEKRTTDQPQSTTEKPKNNE